MAIPIKLNMISSKTVEVLKWLIVPREACMKIQPSSKIITAAYTRANRSNAFFFTRGRKLEYQLKKRKRIQVDKPNFKGLIKAFIPSTSLEVVAMRMPLVSEYNRAINAPELNNLWFKNVEARCIKIDNVFLPTSGRQCML